MDLRNPSVLVTGGSCGIGLETARLLRLIVSMLEIEDRGFVTESTIWATNPNNKN